MSLLTQVAEFLNRKSLQASTGIIAVSGGPDSVALAHLLHQLLNQGCLERLILAHVNHQLRGPESDADEAFVQGLPALWQGRDDPRVRVCSTRIDMAARAEAEHGNLESIARRERYRWLGELAISEQASWVAAGHTADDQAETVLFRLLRGTGVHGLAGMSDCRDLRPGVLLVRPLLEVRRRAVIEYLDERQIPYRVDSSNRDPAYTRNRLRLELLPSLEQEYNPRIVEVLAQLAQQARELAEDVERHAQRLLAEAELPRAGTVVVFALDRLQAHSPNEIREMFRQLWTREGWPGADMDFKCWQHLAELVHGVLPAWDFPGNVHAVRRGRVLQLQSA